MKLFTLLVLFFVVTATATAQVQIDHTISLTGTGTNAKVTGIKAVDNTQDAVSADYIQRDSLKFAVATGSSNAYVVNLTPAVTSAYTVGMVVYFKANAANTGATTVQVNGLSPVTLKKNGTADLAANDIQNNQMVSAIYDGTNFQVLSPLPAGAATADPTLIYTTNGF